MEMMEIIRALSALTGIVLILHLSAQAKKHLRQRI